MNTEELKDKIIELPNEEFFELRKWIQKDESNRRYKIQSDERAKEHIKKIKKFRKGHKLIITQNIHSGRKIAIPIGSIVKLEKAKGQRTKVEIYYAKTDEVWLIPFNCVADANDESAKQNVNASKALADIFRR